MMKYEFPTPFVIIVNEREIEIHNDMKVINRLQRNISNGAEFYHNFPNTWVRDISLLVDKELNKPFKDVLSRLASSQLIAI